MEIERNKKASLKFEKGAVHIDTLLIRKRRLGLFKDSLLTVFNDTVRSIPYDSLWNIYTKDDSLRNTGKAKKRIVMLNGKKLIFALGKNDNNSITSTANTNTQTPSSSTPTPSSNTSSPSSNPPIKDTGKIGVGEPNPLYTLDISTPSFFLNGKNVNNISVSANTDNTNNVIKPDYDTIAVRINHGVSEPVPNQSDYNAHTSYGLMINEQAGRAFGRSAIGFQSVINKSVGNNNSGIVHGKSSYVKARLWSETGRQYRATKFGIDVADKDRKLNTRLVIDSNGNVGIGTLTPYSLVHIAGPGSRKDALGNPVVESSNMSVAKGGAYTEPSFLLDIENKKGNNYIRVQGGASDDYYSGIWFTEIDNTYGFKIRNSGKTDDLDFIFTTSNKVGLDNDKENNGVTIMRLVRAHPRNNNTSFGYVDVAPNDGTPNKHIRMHVHGGLQIGLVTNWSDSALKTQVRTLDKKQSEQQILSLRPVSYYLKDELVNPVGEKPQIDYGFIAQEVERSALGDLVTITNSKGDNGKVKEPDGTLRPLKSLNYIGIIAPLVAFSQGLYEDKQKLEDKVQQLQEQLANSNQQLANLQEQVRELTELIRNLQNKATNPQVSAD